MAGWLDSPAKKFQELPAATRFFIQAAVFLLFALFAPSGARLLPPLAMLFFWSVLSTENRTVTVSTIILALGVGMIGVIPAAMLVEMPLILILGKDSVVASACSAAMETALLATLLVGLSIWPKSRLRYTGSILDFTILGLALGAGLEIGIAVIHPGAGSFKGISLGMLPQLPGMIGSTQHSGACSSPALWGMFFGAVTGIARYLIGPDLNGYWARGIVITLAAIFLAWIFMERLAFNQGQPAGFLGTFYWIDLKGRSLAYGTGLGVMVTTLVEWLLFQERPQAGVLKHALKVYEAAWSEGDKVSLFERMMRVLAVYEKRCLVRELIVAQETKPVLRQEDHGRLQERVRKVESLLGIKEGEVI